MSSKHFIFGYGSLICPDSRRITAPTLSEGMRAEPLPVSIKNLKRSWIVPCCFPAFSDDSCKVKGMTVLGVQRCEENSNSKCNGVLIEVNEYESKQFDIREENYTRAMVNIQDIIFSMDLMDKRQFENDQNIRISPPHPVLEQVNKQRRGESKSNNNLHVWIYLFDDDYGFQSNESFPICQSYVDIVLRGCLNISNDFAKTFVETTHGWPIEEEETTNKDSGFLMDDRHDPLYSRADMIWSSKNATRLNTFIQNIHPHIIIKTRLINA